MRTVLHISDIHFGRVERSVVEALFESCNVLQPDLVIISGDLTQRAKHREFAEARHFLERLTKSGLTFFVVPGNHDIHPLYLPLSRGLTPFERYKEYISKETEPVYEDEELAIVSIDTVRASTIKSGRISPRQLARVKEWFLEAKREAVRIVVTHHPLDLPGEFNRHKLVWRATKAVQALSESHVDMYLSGHYHRSSVTTTSRRYRHARKNPALAIQAGTVSTRERGEPPAFNLLTIKPPSVSVETYRFDSKQKAFIHRETNALELTRHKPRSR